MRQIGKQILTLTNPYRVLFALLLSLALSMPAGAQTRSVVTSFLTGVAIAGYDPVSYFTELEPLMGSPLHEYEWQGVPWYFASAANRDVFIAAPEVYAPMFGGHCAMSMARGHLSDGNPLIYRVIDDKLLLFFSIGNREAFDISQAESLPRAIGRWDTLPEPPRPPDALRLPVTGE